MDFLNVAFATQAYKLFTESIINPIHAAGGVYDFGNFGRVKLIWPLAFCFE
jgi:hypothetical protein